VYEGAVNNVKCVFVNNEISMSTYSLFQSIDNSYIPAKSTAKLKSSNSKDLMKFQSCKSINAENVKHSENNLHDCSRPQGVSRTCY